MSVDDFLDGGFEAAAAQDVEALLSKGKKENQRLCRSVKPLENVANFSR